MPISFSDSSIDEYLRRRLMPVEGTIPNLPGIQMYGKSIPAGNVGGDLFEYVNFQQRYDIDARIRRALELSREFRQRASVVLGGIQCRSPSNWSLGTLNASGIIDRPVLHKSTTIS